MKGLTPLGAAIAFLENDQTRDLLGLHRIRVAGEMVTRGELAERLRSVPEPEASPASYGGRVFAPVEVDLIDTIRLKAEEVRVLVERVQSTANIDGRCASIARTELQTGFMWLVRAVAKPTSF